MGYEYCHGIELHSEKDEVLVVDDLLKYLMRRYSNLSDSEIARFEARVRTTDNTPYEINRSFLRLLANGFDLRRNNSRNDSVHIELADYASPRCQSISLGEPVRGEAAAAPHTGCSHPTERVSLWFSIQEPDERCRRHARGELVSP